MLLKPWRNLEDLKDSSETFSSAFNKFLDYWHTNKKISTILNNIQHYHKCSDAVAEKCKQDRMNDREYLSSTDVTMETSNEFNDDVLGDQMEPLNFEDLPITETLIEEARRHRESQRDRSYGEKAIKVAMDAGIFQKSMRFIHSVGIA